MHLSAFCCETKEASIRMQQNTRDRLEGRIRAENFDATRKTYEQRKNSICIGEQKAKPEARK